MSNGFDDLNIAPKKAEYMPTPYDTLLHRVFYQTDAGKELLQVWSDGLVNSAVVDINANYTDLQIGSLLGYSKCKQDIIRTIKRINNGGM